MSLFGALSASLTALTAQSRAVNVISNNIANLSTTGYKSSSVSFSTLVAGTVGGGVLDRIRQDVSTQGAVSSTGVGTDLAIQGSGFFVVKDTAGGISYTRAGSFRPNADGNLVNEAGYILQGWPLDADGRLPGAAGNTTYTTNSSDPESLVNISTADISGTASPTTGITAKMNLDASEDILEGAGDTISLVSSTNSTNSSTDLLLPTYTGTTAQFTIGSTTLTLTNNNGTRTYTYGGIEQSVDITAPAGLNVASATADLGFTDGETLTIATDSLATVTFTYRSANADPDSNEFTSLNDLIDLIDGTDGLRARVLSVDSGAEVYMFIGSEDPSENVTFGGDLEDAGNLGLSNITGNANYFASLGDLNNLIQANITGDEIDSVVNTPTVSATLDVFNVDPRESITFNSNDAQFLSELGLTSTAIGAAYDASDADTNMTSGAISADFSRPITIYTSQGGPLNVNLSFVRLVDNDSESIWGVELYAPQIDGEETVDGQYTNAPGLIAYGTISFNGDGTLRTVLGDIASPFDIDPVGLAEAVEVTLNFGTEESLDGLTSFASASRANSFTQNGFPTGQLQSLQIDSEGFVTAVFDNSLTSQVYKLPIAYFSNPNGLIAESGNTYSATTESGSQNFGEVGVDSNVGSIVPGALEVSTAEIGNELTKLIVSQQSYSASTNVLRKVSDLFEELRNI